MNTSASRVTAHVSSFSGAIHGRVPPRGGSMLRIGGGWSRHENPKSVMRARPPPEINTFSCRASHSSLNTYASTTGTDPFQISMGYTMTVQVIQSAGDIQELQHVLLSSTVDINIDIPMDGDPRRCLARIDVHCLVPSIPSRLIPYGRTWLLFQATE